MDYCDINNPENNFQGLELGQSSKISLDSRIQGASNYNNDGTSNNIDGNFRNRNHNNQFLIGATRHEQSNKLLCDFQAKRLHYNKYTEKDPRSPSSHRHLISYNSIKAERNRAAQRAFRLRKEQYVKDLEYRAVKLDEMNYAVSQLIEENQYLKQQIQRISQEISKYKMSENEIMKEAYFQDYSFTSESRSDIMNLMLPTIDNENTLHETLIKRSSYEDIQDQSNVPKRIKQKKVFG
ncbi:hypothetical protein AYI69_g7151 [Smittium culicis]|uniref:BZIP domain-containing protein n=1 Tax=Smittium culicis TaxID=133412 RepID=A0A1R1XU15_9FUNG|nr:hypothetical protein AYI69_g7151 [Smittium culicis]